nr:Tat pathway signal sequence domain protein [uncultured Microbacterium sp.]
MTDSVTVPLRWLDDDAPTVVPAGVTWGAPFPRGRVASVSELRLRRDGQTLPAQFWPLATWPDGSLKWAGAALGATEGPLDGRFEIVASAGGDDPAHPHPVSVHRDGASVVVRNGVVSVELGGPHDASGAIIRSITRGSTVVAEDLGLISLRQGEVREDGGGAPREHFRSRVSEVVVEQEGPVRAVVRIEGAHRSESGGRDWLPFIVRLTVAAGSEQIDVVHTMIWDGDGDTDFLAGLGLRGRVPLRAELHDRHLRFAGADGGFFAEAVRGLTGLRRDPGAEVRAAQIAGAQTSPPAQWNPEVSERLDLIPAWSDATLTQLSADGFSIRKRTAAGHAWIDAGAGTRAAGYASLSDPSGGLGIGVRGFWQSYPGQLDIRGAASDEAEITAWLYAPQAQAMDVRFYHDGLGQDDFATQLDALEITYEDYEPGFGDARGVARTHELSLFAYARTPRIEQAADDVSRLQARPLLQPTPEHLHAVGVFGDWAPVDRSTPLRAEIEDSIDFLLEFYLGQIDQRSWYGFWNYGDVMHAYDLDRHVWRYDVGGYAWDNSELSPDLWLWYSYLRSGRSDVFRLAEAMTRHTGEVDVYHLGRWKGLGSRHNVQHWGCSAKQLRISSPIYRRIYYYLTADERVGDLLTELRDSDERFLDTDPTRKVRTDAATYRPDRAALAVGLGTDWGALAATWLTDWERTGNTRSRDRLLGTMEDIGALPKGFLTGEALYDLDSGRFDTTRDRVSVSHLNAVFGLVEVCSELISLVDVPGFREAWVEYCRLYLATPEQQIEAVGVALDGIHLEQAHSRLAAYAARSTDDPELADLAWKAFEGMGEWLVHRRDFTVQRVEPPRVLNPVDEVASVSTNDAAQYGLAAIQNLALIGDRLR